MKIKHLFFGLFTIVSIQSYAANHSIDLTGTNEIVTCPSPLVGNTTFTVELWYNGTGSNPSDRLISITGNQLELSAGLGELQFYDGTWTSTGVTGLDNGWHHVAVTNNLDSIRIYVDGAKVFSKLVTAYSFQASDLFAIGAKEDGIGNISAHFDEVRIWGDARNDAEIAATYKRQIVGSETNLLLYYNFNKSDLTSSLQAGGVDLTSSGAVTFQNEGFDAYLDNYALNFDTMDDIATMTTFPLSGNSDFTLEAQFKSSNTLDVESRIFRWLPIHMEIALKNGLIKFYQTSWEETSTVGLNNGVWHHIAAVHNAGTLTVYVDGLEIHQAAVSPFSFDTKEMSIGGNGTNGGFGGELDEIRVWSIAKTNQEIINTMNTELEGDEPALVAYFDFNSPSVSQTILGTNNSANLLRAGNNSTNLWPQFQLEPQKHINQANASITELQTNDKLIVFPNPSNGEVSAELPQKYNEVHYKVYSASMQLIYEDQVSDISTLTINNIQKTGVYFLEVRTDNGELFINKLVVE